MKSFRLLRTFVALWLIPCLLTDARLAPAFSAPRFSAASPLFMEQALQPRELLNKWATGSAYSLRTMAGRLRRSIRPGKGTRADQKYKDATLTFYRMQTDEASVVAQELRRRFTRTGGSIAFFVWLIFLPAIVPYEGMRIVAAEIYKFIHRLLSRHGWFLDKISLNIAADQSIFIAIPKTIYNILTGLPFKVSASHIGAWPVFPWGVRIVGHLTNFLIAILMTVHIFGTYGGRWIFQESENWKLLWHSAAIITLFASSAAFVVTEAVGRYLRRYPDQAQSMVVIRWIVRLGNSVVLVLVGLPLLVHGIMHVAPEFILADPVWNRFFLFCVSLDNAVFLAAQVIVGIAQKRGSLYSLLYQYDDKFPSLLSAQEGRYRLSKMVKDYVNSSPAEVSPYIGLIRLDDFYDIADNRMGPALADQMRDRIFSKLVQDLRREFPGALISATADKNEVLISLPERSDSEGLEAEVRTVIRNLYHEWLHTGYYILDMPQLSQLKQKLTGKEWRALIHELEDGGIYWSDYMGGRALAVKTPIEGVLPRDRQVVTLEEAQISLNAVFERANALGLGLGRSNISLKNVRVEENSVAHPPFPVTITACILGVRDLFDAASLEMRGYAVDNTRAAFPLARRLLEVQSDEQRKDRVLIVMERALQSFRKAFGENHGRVTVLKDPRWTRDGIEMVARSVFVDLVPPNREIALPNSRHVEATLHLLPAGLPGGLPPSQVSAVSVSEEVAALNLRTRSFALSAEGRYQRGLWDSMLAVYRSLTRKGKAARVFATFISGLSAAQAQGYLVAIPKDAWPSETVLAIHNPVPAEENVKEFFGGATGNGMAVLNVALKTYQRLARDRVPGDYDVRDEILGDRVTLEAYGAGESSRSPGFSNLGKPAGKLPTDFAGALNGRVATMADVLMVEGLALASALPREVNGKKNGGGAIIYGDNAKPFDMNTLKTFFEGLHTANGFTLVLGEVPFYEAIKWGVASLEPEGRVRRFYEKPMPAMSKDDRDALMKYIDDRDEMKPAEIERVQRDILPRVRAHLGPPESGGLGLLNEKRDGTATIYMNAGVGIKGAGAQIRFMQLAGAQFDFDSAGVCHLKVMPALDDAADASAAVTPGDPQGYLALLEEDLVGILDQHAGNPQGMQEAVQSLSIRIHRGQAHEHGSEAINILQNIEAKLESVTADEAAVRSAIIEGLREANEKLSVFQGYLRDGLELDAMGGIAAKMAVDPLPGDQLFGEGLKLLNAEERDRISQAASRPEQKLPVQKALELFAQTETHFRKSRLSFNRVRPSDVSRDDLSKLMDDLLVEMGRLRTVYRTRETADKTSGELRALQLVYQAQAAVLWNARAWLIMRADRPGDPLPYVCGFVSRGVWFDLGSSKEIWQNFTASLKGAMVAAGLGLKMNLRSTLRSAVPSAESTVDWDLDIPGRMQDTSNLINCWIGGGYIPGRAREWFMDAGSRVENTQFPWGGHLLRNVNVAEGIVERRELEGKGSSATQVTKQYVVHTLWNHSEDKSPANNDIFMGRHLLPYKDDDGTEHAGWLADNNVHTDSPREFWRIPVFRNTGLFWQDNGKENLSRAKLFPGISYRLMMASADPGKNRLSPSDAQDSLDWNLFEAMPSIWGWLQGDPRYSPRDEHGRPAEWFKTWLEAKNAGRLFSMRDHHTLRGQGIAASVRRTRISNEIDTRLRTMNGEPSREPLYWFTGVPQKRVIELFPSEFPREVAGSSAPIISIITLGIALFILLISPVTGFAKDVAAIFSDFSGTLQLKGQRNVPKLRGAA